MIRTAPNLNIQNAKNEKHSENPNWDRTCIDSNITPSDRAAATGQCPWPSCLLAIIQSAITDTGCREVTSLAGPWSQDLAAVSASCPGIK